MHFRNYIILFLLAFLTCCHPEDNRDASKFKLELENRKLQRITEGQFINFTSQACKYLLDSNFNITKSKNLSKISTEFGISIVEIEVQKTPITGKLNEVKEAYIYNVENKIKSEDNLQKENDSIYIYTRPIIINDSLKNIIVAYVNKKKLIRKYTDNFKPSIFQ